MPRTIHCTSCGVALNVPEQAAGRRLKCPKCGTKFYPHDTGPAASSSAIGLHDASPDSSQDFRRRAPSDEGLPTAAGDLRETFDLPLMMEAVAPAATKPAREAGDALALFHDDRPAAPRRPTGAEARAKARRCPTCGGVVPMGMSICATCGLDLETGMRVGLDDDLAPPPPPRAPGPPITVLIVGGLCGLGSVILAIYAMMLSLGGMAGAGYFVPVALFGTFAAVQYLRGKSVKLLLLALAVGAAIDVVGLIAMPIVKANTDTVVVKRSVPIDDPDVEEDVIPSVADQLDTKKLTTGITILGLYAALSIYLLTPGMSKHLRR